MKKYRLICLLAMSSMLLPACSAPVTTVRVLENQGLIMLVVKPDDAHVHIDGVDKGEASSYEEGKTALIVESGLRKLEIKKEGYKTFQKEVYMSGGTLYEIKVNLEKTK